MREQWFRYVGDGMSKDWITPVLEDIRVFSELNQMPKTEAKIREVLRVLESEQENV